MAKLYQLSLLPLTLLLSGCLFSPGMHMKPTPAPSLNARNEIVKPLIVPINVALIQTQRMEAEKLQADAIKNYQAPAGFSVATAGYNYRVGEQDVLTITTWDPSHLTGDAAENTSSRQMVVTVDTGGLIYYPYVGYVDVMRKTAHEIRDLLTIRLTQVMKNPQINVSVSQFHSQKVDVTGAVHEPQTIAVSNVPLTVLTAIKKAGGPLRCGIDLANTNAALCADLKNIEVTKGNQHTTLDLDSLVAIDGTTSVNWILEDGDRVYVPSNTPYRVFVLGSVVRPGPYAMTGGRMTLREALGNAHGTTNMSDPSYTYVIRNYNRNPEIFSLDAHSPDSFNLASDFELRKEDVVFVSASKMETFNAILGQVNPSLITAVSTKALLK